MSGSQHVRQCWKHIVLYEHACHSQQSYKQLTKNLHKLNQSRHPQVKHVSPNFPWAQMSWQWLHLNTQWQGLQLGEEWFILNLITDHAIRKHALFSCRQIIVPCLRVTVEIYYSLTDYLFSLPLFWVKHWVIGGKIHPREDTEHIHTHIHTLIHPLRQFSVVNQSTNEKNRWKLGNLEETHVNTKEQWTDSTPKHWSKPMTLELWGGIAFPWAIMPPFKRMKMLLLLYFIISFTI